MSDEEIIALALAAGFEQEEICLSGNGESDRRLTVGEYPICDAVMALVRPIIERAEQAEAERDALRALIGRHNPLGIDTGDTVFHRPSRETWLVAFVRDDRLAWCGWPEGYARVADCLLVEKATESKRAVLLRELADRRDSDEASRYA